MIDTDGEKRPQGVWEEKHMCTKNTKRLLLPFTAFTFTKYKNKFTYAHIKKKTGENHKSQPISSYPPQGQHTVSKICWFNKLYLWCPQTFLYIMPLLIPFNIPTSKTKWNADLCGWFFLQKLHGMSDKLRHYRMWWFSWLLLKTLSAWDSVRQARCEIVFYINTVLYGKLRFEYNMFNKVSYSLRIFQENRKEEYEKYDTLKRTLFSKIKI